MVKAKGTGSTPDYERVANLVFDYRGEKTIILPPPTLKKDSFVVPVEHRDKDVNASTYQSYQEILRNGSFLDYLMQRASERLKEKEQQSSKILDSTVVHKSDGEPQESRGFKDYSQDVNNSPSKSKGRGIT